MLYDIYRYIFIGAAILAAILFIISVILFFVLKIPSVIGDLSGATARKAIENIRNQNESQGENVYKSNAVNKERSKLTDKISPSGSLLKNPTGSIWGAMGTEKISTQKLSEEATNETTVLGSNETTVLGSNETTVLGAGNETTVLSVENETTILASNETTVLNSGETTQLGNMPAMNETSVLTPDMIPSGIFEIEYEITFIHTSEVIV